MKKAILFIMFAAGILLPTLFSGARAEAQYSLNGYGYVPAYGGYGYGGYGYAPAYGFGLYPGYGFGCLTGCSGAWKAVAITNLSLYTLDQIGYMHDVTKASDAQIELTKYKAQAAKSFPNNPGYIRDYYNMKSVESFFDDSIPVYTPKNKTPDVAPLTKQGKE